MLNYILIAIVTSLLLAFAVIGFAYTKVKPEINLPAVMLADDLESYLAKIVEDNNLPALAAAVIDSSGTKHLGAAGYRKYGGTEKATKEDVFHLGSNTKAMTSFLVAMCIDEGLLRWETTIGEIFPNHLAQIDESYHPVTIHELLTHTSGITANAANWWAYLDMPIIERRRTIMTDNLKTPSVNPRGEHVYSNLGYMVAGSMLEKLTNRSWEQLMQEKIFDKLGMKTAGFGIPGTLKEEDQPWGHTKSILSKKWNPIQADNSEALGPAGTVYCSLSDWGKYIAAQFFDSGTPLLSIEQREKLMEPQKRTMHADGLC